MDLNKIAELKRRNREAMQQEQLDKLKAAADLEVFLNSEERRRGKEFLDRVTFGAINKVLSGKY
jgi:hypothetical protein